jgi:ABC-type phosphate transport system substrate-binding protein
VAGALVLGPLPSPAQEPGFELIVNAANAGSVVKKDLVASIFMGKVNRWGDGKPIAPVDQSAQSVVRARFTREVMNDSVAAIMTYWTRQMVSGGARPPAVKQTDADVIAFVAGNPAAIGYVNAGQALPPTVKKLRVE